MKYRIAIWAAAGFLVASGWAAKARDAWGWKWLEDLTVDLRFGVRMLRKNPVLTLVAILTLALGIGANTAIFTLLYGLVLRSLPAANAGQLVKVGMASAAIPDDAGGAYMPYRMMKALSEEQSSFRELSAWSADQVLMRDHEDRFRDTWRGWLVGTHLDFWDCSLSGDD